MTPSYAVFVSNQYIRSRNISSFQQRPGLLQSYKKQNTPVNRAGLPYRKGWQQYYGQWRAHYYPTSPYHDRHVFGDETVTFLLILRGSKRRQRNVDKMARHSWRLRANIAHKVNIRRLSGDETYTWKLWTQGRTERKEIRKAQNHSGEKVEKPRIAYRYQKLNS